MDTVNPLIYCMIKSFGDNATSDLFHGITSNKTRKLPTQIHDAAIYKLDILNAATSLDIYVLRRETDLKHYAEITKTIIVLE